MKKISAKTWDIVLRSLDSVFSIAVLPFGLFMFDSRADYSNYLKNRLFAAATFLTFCLSMLCQAFRRKNRSEPYGWQLIQAGVYLVSVILILVVPSSDVAFPIITFLLAAMLILNRVLSIVRKCTYRNVLFNVACIC